MKNLIVIIYIYAVLVSLSICYKLMKNIFYLGLKLPIDYDSNISAVLENEAFEAIRKFLAKHMAAK